MPGIGSDYFDGLLNVRVRFAHLGAIDFIHGQGVEEPVEAAATRRTPQVVNCSIICHVDAWLECGAAIKSAAVENPVHAQRI